MNFNWCSKDFVQIIKSTGYIFLHVLGLDWIWSLFPQGLVSFYMFYMCFDFTWFTCVLQVLLCCTFFCWIVTRKLWYPGNPFFCTWKLNFYEHIIYTSIRISQYLSVLVFVPILMCAMECFEIYQSKNCGAQHFWENAQHWGKILKEAKKGLSRGQNRFPM